MENNHRENAGVDMSYDEFQKLCRKAWKEAYNYLYVDRSKMKIETNSFGKEDKPFFQRKFLSYANTFEDF